MEIVGNEFQSYYGMLTPVKVKKGVIFFMLEEHLKKTIAEQIEKNLIEIKQAQLEIAREVAQLKKFSTALIKAIEPFTKPKTAPKKETKEKKEKEWVNPRKKAEIKIEEEEEDF